MPFQALSVAPNDMHFSDNPEFCQTKARQHSSRKPSSFGAWCERWSQWYPPGLLGSQDQLCLLHTTDAPSVAIVIGLRRSPPVRTGMTC